MMHANDNPHGQESSHVQSRMAVAYQAPAQHAYDMTRISQLLSPDAEAEQQQQLHRNEQSASSRIIARGVPSQELRRFEELNQAKREEKDVRISRHVSSKTSFGN